MLVWIYMSICPFNIYPGPCPSLFWQNLRILYWNYCFPSEYWEDFSSLAKMWVCEPLGQKDVYSLDSNDSDMIKRHVWGCLLSERQPPDQSLLAQARYCGSCSIVSSTALVPHLFSNPGLQAPPHSLSSLYLSNKSPFVKVSQSPFLLLSTEELWHMQSLRQLRNWEDIKCGMKKKKGSMPITQNLKSDH